MTKEQQAEQLIIRLEGCKLQAYLDSAGVPTIGVGTTVYPNGTKVKLGDTCTMEQAKAWLQDHLKKFVYPKVDDLVFHADSYTDEVYAALCSFGYNIGCGVFVKESFMSHVKNENWGAFDEDACVANGLAGTFLKYDKERVNGVLVPSKGLKNRRVAEIKYMLGMSSNCASRTSG